MSSFSNLVGLNFCNKVPVKNFPCSQNFGEDFCFMFSKSFLQIFDGKNRSGTAPFVFYSILFKQNVSYNTVSFLLSCKSAWILSPAKPGRFNLSPVLIATQESQLISKCPVGKFQSVSEIWVPTSRRKFRF